MHFEYVSYKNVYFSSILLKENAKVLTESYMILPLKFAMVATRNFISFVHPSRKD